MKAFQAGALAVAVCFSLGATDASSRVASMNHRLMCQCGCAQLLGECDHLGCPSREPEMAELRTAVAAGKGDQEIFDQFVAKYGAVVLAAPTTHGFDLVAWIAPFAVFGAALLGTILLVRRWSVGKTQAVGGLESANLDPAERERLEEIRRETGSDGGF
jgi:cytochrome c-type biogenesis protein CcmH